jgi:hypothetical protein
MSWCSDDPEDEAISLFAGLLANPDVPSCFAPHRHKVLMKGILDQFVRDSPVGLFVCTRRGDVVVYLDNFTFPLAL